MSGKADPVMRVQFLSSEAVPADLLTIRAPA
jgi:hypothetical protein